MKYYEYKKENFNRICLAANIFVEYVFIENHLIYLCHKIKLYRYTHTKCYSKRIKMPYDL